MFEGFPLPQRNFKKRLTEAHNLVTIFGELPSYDIL
jgi:hypothetical protein